MINLCILRAERVRSLILPVVVEQTERFLLRVLQSNFVHFLNHQEENESLYVEQLTRVTGVAFAGAGGLGINFFTSDSVANADVIKALLWRHEFPGDVFKFSLGHVEITDVDSPDREIGKGAPSEIARNHEVRS